MAKIELTRVSKRYETGRTAVREVSLVINAGEFFTLLGPSGCGKTTTLRMVAGLEAPTEGQIRIGGRDCTHVHPRDRGVGLVFQSYALYPHMTVFENMALNLKVQGVRRDDIKSRVEAIATTLHLNQLLNRRPKHLSGGERQRVALGRALVRNPEVLLMDEPLSNLDLKLREHMRTELKRLHKEYRHTVICVTHDQAEAMTMSDRIAVMRDGFVEQVGTPEEVYERPVNVFVAAFLGSPSMNLLSGRTRGSLGKTAVGDAPISVDVGPVLSEGAKSDESVLVGVRPEDVLVGPKDAPNAIPAKVSLIEPTGAHKLLFLDIWQKEGAATRIVAMVPGHDVYLTEDSVSIRFRPRKQMIFDPSSERFLGFA